MMSRGLPVPASSRTASTSALSAHAAADDPDSRTSALLADAALWQRVVNRFRSPQRAVHASAHEIRPCVDVWWLADDGGLTLLLPSILVCEQYEVLLIG